MAVVAGGNGANRTVVMVVGVGMQCGGVAEHERQRGEGANERPPVSPRTPPLADSIKCLLQQIASSVNGYATQEESGYSIAWRPALSSHVETLPRDASDEVEGCCAES